MEFALLSVIFAKNLTQLLETVHLALKVSLSTKESVSHLNQLDHLIWDVDHGTGTTRSVLPAQETGSSSMKSVFLLVISVLPLKQQETALLAIKDTTFKEDSVLFKT